MWIEKKKIKLTLSSDDMTVCVEKSQIIDQTNKQTLAELESNCRKVN